MASSPKFDSKLLFVIGTIVIGMMMSNVITATEATWCMASTYCGNEALLSYMNWACAHGADCGPIQPGGSCFYPHTLLRHASYAFDSYYQRMGKAFGSCYFGGCATVVSYDPSLGGCKFPPRDESMAGEANLSSVADSSMNNTKS